MLIDKINNSSWKSSENIYKIAQQDGTRQNLIKKRYILAFMGFLGFFTAHSLRASMSVAILDMSTMPSVILVDENEGKAFNESTKAILKSIFWPSKLNQTDTNEYAHNSTTGNHANSFETYFNYAMNFIKANHTIKKATRVHNNGWSSELEGYVLSAFFFGYIFTILLSAFLTTQFGGRLFFGIGIGFCAFLHLLMPIANYISPTSVIVLRISQGLTQGLMFPAMHRLWSKWAPKHQKTRLTTFSVSGAYVGSVCAFSLSGIIGNYLNWQSIFYIFGLFGTVWCFLWFYLIAESPAQHTTIDKEEKDLIESSVSKNTNTSIRNIPWKSIVKSKPVWAIVAVHFAENWGYYTMLTEMPTFFSQFLDFKIEEAGIISALPCLTMTLILYTCAYISDMLIIHEVNYTLVRKSFCCFGIFSQAIFMFLLTQTTNKNFLVALVTLAVGFGGMAWSAFGVNHLDIGAHFANVLMGISNTFGTIPGIVSPTLTGFIIKNKTKSEWNIIFMIASTFYLIGGLMFAICGTAKLQKWAEPCTVNESEYHNLENSEDSKSSKIEISENDSIRKDSEKSSYDAILPVCNNSPFSSSTSSILFF